FKVAGSRQELDEMITSFSTKWKVERLSRVSRALLRMAVAEILQDDQDVPVSVSINEAVELAKKYGGDDDAPFVNGVLGAFARSRGQNAAE
ncbi:MAG: transcription antitermination factor NusB, partial [Oscillospiraceae bacterium]|nr:transcription antitermination factor NusB [Oscillospiraceae bacterium]